MQGRPITQMIGSTFYCSHYTRPPPVFCVVPSIISTKGEHVSKFTVSPPLQPLWFCVFVLLFLFTDWINIDTFGEVCVDSQDWRRFVFSIFVRALIDRCIAQPLTLTSNITIKCWTLTLTPKPEPGPLILKPNLDPHTASGGCEDRQKRPHDQKMSVIFWLNLCSSPHCIACSHTH